MRVIVYHNAASSDDCDGVEVWLEPEGRDAQKDFDSYSYGSNSGMFRREYMESLGYKQAPTEVALLLEE